MSRTNPNPQPDFPQLKPERLKKEDNPNIIMTRNSKEFFEAMRRQDAKEFTVYRMVCGKLNGSYELHISRNPEWKTIAKKTK